MGQSNLTRGPIAPCIGYQLECQHPKIIYIQNCSVHPLANCASVANVIAALLTYPQCAALLDALSL